MEVPLEIPPEVLVEVPSKIPLISATNYSGSYLRVPPEVRQGVLSGVSLPGFFPEVSVGVHLEVLVGLPS